MRAIARRGNGFVADLPGHFRNAASVRARRRRAGGTSPARPKRPRSIRNGPSRPCSSRAPRRR
ncbi:hypothetical protein EAO68_11515 [Streptomyces sp. wa22]|nr:hypothetical protein EAO68_11515 [Streptomyces sp. wa22]